MPQAKERVEQQISGAEFPGATGETSETCEASSTILFSDFPRNNFRMEGGKKLSQPPSPEKYNHVPPLGGGCKG